MCWRHFKRPKLIIRLGLVTLAVLWLASCGLVDERGIYEGIRANQKARFPTGAEGAASKQLPDYDQYKRQREGITKDPP